MIDRAIAVLTRAAAPLVLALSLLLFLQWPLRDLVQAYSREANDLAQIFFALYVAVAITAATRAKAHLAADAIARGYPERTRRRLWRAACALALVPLGLLVLYGGSDAWRSVAILERFPDTLNPGYFLIRVAALIAAVLVLVQALADLFARDRGR